MKRGTRGEASLLLLPETPTVVARIAAPDRDSISKVLSRNQLGGAETEIIMQADAPWQFLAAMAATEAEIATEQGVK